MFNANKEITGGSNLSEPEKAEIAKAARGFEAMFVNILFKQMKESMLDEFKDEEGEGFFGADTLESVSDLAFAQDVSQQGSGIGIARMLYYQLTGGEELEPITTIKMDDKIEGSVYQPEMTAKSINKDKPADLQEAKPANENKVQGNFLDRVASRISAYDNIISNASAKYGVPESLIKSIITAESAGKAGAKSKAGAKGLMQLMDGTAKSLGVSDSFDPYQNIMGGTKYISKMLERFNGNTNLALAAYNAGPGNVDKYDGIPPFKETKNYVRKVNEYMQRFEQ